MADFIPYRDSEFAEWLSALAVFCTLNQVALGLTVQQVDDLNAAQAAFAAAWADYLATRTAAEGATQGKNATRQAAEVIARMLNTIIQANPDVTQEMIADAGLRVRDMTPTVLSPEAILNVPAPQILLFDQRGAVLVKFGVNPANDRENARPEGTLGAAIYCAVGGIPGEVAEAGPWEFVAIDTNSPYNHVAPAPVNKTLAYKARWIDRLQRPGLFCDPVTIAYTAD